MIYIQNSPINLVPTAMHTTHSEGLNLQPEEAQVYPPENNYTNIRNALLRLGIKATYRAIQSDNFVTSVSGWKLFADGSLEANEGTFRGSLEAGSIHIPDQTTANSFHTETDGDSYWGCNVADWTSDNDNANAYILKTGVAKFQNITLGGSVVLSGLQAGSAVDGQYLDGLSVQTGALANLAITAGKIANATITATQIANATITGTQVASGTITSDNITNATITGTDIASATITGSNIGATTIQAGNIANATITTSQISGSAGITGGQIANATITTSQISNTAGIIGGQIDNLTITAGNIANLTITTSQIANSTIVGGDIAQNTITGGASGNLVAATITGTEIAATTIAAGNIVANTITSNELTTGVFVTATANITDAIITNAKINDLAVSKLTAGTITSQAITLAVLISGTIDSYSESNASVEQPIYSITKIGQSFTGNDGILNTCKFYLKKSGSSTGNAVAKVYAHDGGTYGTDGKPTGTALATSDNFDVSTLTTSNQLIEFTFTGDEKITLTNGTYYFIVLEYNDGTPTNHIKISYDGSSPTHSGNMVTGTWTSWSGNDLCFYVYASSPTDTKIQAGKTDFGDTANGFILGIDASDSDKTKLEIGDTDDYLKWGDGLEVKGKLDHANFYWNTLFESLDGFSKRPNGGTIQFYDLAPPAGEQIAGVQFITSATSGNTLKFFKDNIYHSALSFNNDTRMRASLKQEQATNQTAYFTVGGTGTTKHIGLKIVNNEIFGTCANGTTQSLTASLVTIPAGSVVQIEVRLKVGNKVEFKVVYLGTAYTGELTTNLPAGNIQWPLHITITPNENVAKEFHIQYWDVWNAE